MIRQSFFPSSYKNRRRLLKQQPKKLAINNSSHSINSDLFVPVTRKSIVLDRHKRKKSQDLQLYPCATLGDDVKELRPQTEQMKNRSQNGIRILSERNTYKVGKHSFMLFSNRKQFSEIKNLRPKKTENSIVLRKDSLRKKEGEKRPEWNMRPYQHGKLARRTKKSHPMEDV